MTRLTRARRAPRQQDLTKERNEKDDALKKAQRNHNNGLVLLAENAWNFSGTPELANNLLDGVPADFFAEVIGAVGFVGGEGEELGGG